MKDRKEQSDLAQQLSNTCVKLAATALALSAATFALAEKFHEAPAFEAFGKFEIARETLNAQIADLRSDSC